MIPNRVLKDFAPELAPLVMDIYNCSLREGYDPDLLKRSIINPLPKVSRPQEIQSDLRPIFLTCTLAKVMEGFARCRLVAQISEKPSPTPVRKGGALHQGRLDLNPTGDSRWQLIVGIVGLECSLPITQRVLT